MVREEKLQTACAVQLPPDASTATTRPNSHTPCQSFTEGESVATAPGKLDRWWQKPSRAGLSCEATIWHAVPQHFVSCGCHHASNVSKNKARAMPQILATSLWPRAVERALASSCSSAHSTRGHLSMQPHLFLCLKHASSAHRESQFSRLWNCIIPSALESRVQNIPKKVQL